MKRFLLLRQRRQLRKTPVHSSTSAAVQMQFFLKLGHKNAPTTKQNTLQTDMLQQKQPNKQHKAGVLACCRFYRRQLLESAWPLPGLSTGIK